MNRGTIGTPLVIRLGPRVFRVRMTGMLFDTNKTFLLPSALKSIRAFKKIWGAHPEVKVLIVGHADRVDNAEHNRKLSVERAKSIQAYLRDDVNAWHAVHTPGVPPTTNWGSTEDKKMLGALGFATVADYRSSKGLGPGGAAGPDTRKALIADYMAKDQTQIPDTAAIEVHGCGETHQEVPTNDGVANEKNRRVEIFLFEDKVAPPKVDPCKSGGCDEYEKWKEASRETIDLGLDMGGVVVTVTDQNGAPVPDVDVHLAGFVPEDGKTGAAGVAEVVDVIPAHYEVFVRKDGFEANKTEIDVPPGATVAAALVLKAANGALEVLVRDDNDVRLKGASVAISGPPPKTDARATDDGGRALFHPVPAGLYQILVTLPDERIAGAAFAAGGGGAGGDSATANDEVKPDKKTTTVVTFASPPEITRFVGEESSRNLTSPQETVVLGPGQTAQLFWTIKGKFDDVHLQPGNIDVFPAMSVNPDAAESSGVLLIDVTEKPPDAQGKYTLVASKAGKKSAPRELQIVAITELTVAMKRPQPGEKTLTKPDGATIVGLIAGRTGHFVPSGNNLTPPKVVPKIEAPGFLGQVTLDSVLLFNWSVIGPSPSVRLTIGGVPFAPDVTSQTKDGRGSTEVRDHNATNPGANKKTFMDAQLDLLPAGSAAGTKPLVSAILRLREARPMPGIVDGDDGFRVTHGGSPVFDGAVVPSWTGLVFHWKLFGDVEDNRLLLRVRDASGTLLDEVELKGKGDSALIGTKPATGGPFIGPLTLEANLVNLFDASQGKREMRIAINTASVDTVLRVKVTDDAPTPNVLPGVPVTVIDSGGGRHTASTGSAGTADFKFLPAGSTRVVPRAQQKRGQKIVTMPSTPPPPDGIVRVTVAMEAVAVEVLVEDRDLNVPLRGLTVEVEEGAGVRTKALRTTDDLGLVQFGPTEITNGVLVRILDDRAAPPFPYAEGNGTTLPDGSSTKIRIPDKRRVANLLAARFRIVRRLQWAKLKPKFEKLELDWDYDTVVVHHSGNDSRFQDSLDHIEQTHMVDNKPPFDDVGYHYIIDRSGFVVEGRHLAFKGAHAAKKNTRKIGILVMGCFNPLIPFSREPNTAQITTLIELILQLEGLFPLKILGAHLEVTPVTPKGEEADCPGQRMMDRMDGLRSATGLAKP